MDRCWIQKDENNPTDEFDTIAVAVKGTSTLEDAYFDTDLFAFIKVLQVMSFVGPVLKILPRQFVAWLMMTAKHVSGFSQYEANTWLGMADSVNALKKDFPNSTVVITGHSLGGLIAEVVADMTSTPALLWSAPGATYAERFLNVSEESTQRDIEVIMPDFDQVPRVDLQSPVLQRIQCLAKGGTLRTDQPAMCHKVAKSACEVWRVCGDYIPSRNDKDPLGRDWRNRDFSTTCSEFVNHTELGQLYPVRDSPIEE